MTEIPRIFRRFVPQLLHVIVLPVFFFSFILIYMPFGINDFLGEEWFGVHVALMTSIVLVSVLIMRLIYYFVPMRINYTIYGFWCAAEAIFTSFFVALYLWLVLGKPMPYLEMLIVALQYVILVLLIPYSILALSLRLAEYNNRKSAGNEDEAQQRMRFYDEKHNLKLVLLSDALLYIEADFNYVNIYYMENGKVRNYNLRSSMKALDELCQDHGLLRCHRSFYINPKHVKVLRKDKEGIVYAELDALDVRHIPVTKRYYDRLSEMLY
ncbi:MAG: hypothetical protein E7118_03870 [Bacteroidales bacterium]|nr:hypothetical protein [Bacteroidales bacterium]